MSVNAGTHECERMSARATPQFYRPPDGEHSQNDGPAVAVKSPMRAWDTHGQHRERPSTITSGADADGHIGDARGGKPANQHGRGRRKDGSPTCRHQDGDQWGKRAWSVNLAAGLPILFFSHNLILRVTSTLLHKALKPVGRIRRIFAHAA